MNDTHDWFGWEEAMQEVVENENSERVERMTPLESPRGSIMEVPPAIIESATVDSEPLIRLDSLESVTLRHIVEEQASSSEQPEENESVTADGSWLDVEPSSSSKGSEGSYADQVLAFSGSGSAIDPLDVAVYKVKKGSTVTSILTGPSTLLSREDAPMMTSFSPAGRSLYDTPSDEAFGKSVQPPIHVVDDVDMLSGSAERAEYSKHSTGVDDILGPRVMAKSTMASAHTRESEGVDEILGPMEKIVLPSPDSIDEVLGSPRNQPELDILPTPQESAVADELLMESQQSQSEIDEDVPTSKSPIITTKGKTDMAQDEKLIDPPTSSFDDMQPPPTFDDDEVRPPPSFDNVKPPPSFDDDVRPPPSFDDVLMARTKEHNESPEAHDYDDMQMARTKEHNESPEAHDYDDDIVVGRILQSLGNHQRAQRVPSRNSHSVRRDDSVVSRDSSFPVDTSRSEGVDSSTALSPTSDYRRRSGSAEDSFSGDSSTETYTEAFSPTSQSDVVFSRQDSLSQQDTHTIHTYSYGESTYSRVDSSTLSATLSATLSRADSADPSFLSNQTGLTARTGRTNYTEYTDPSEYTGTDASTMERTGPTLSRGSISQVESNGTGFFKAIERAVTNIASPRNNDDAKERSGAPSSFLHQFENILELPDPLLLESAKSNVAGLYMALEEAVTSNLGSPRGQDDMKPDPLNTVEEDTKKEPAQPEIKQPEKKKPSQFTESLFVQTRSRADPNAQAVRTSPSRYSGYKRPTVFKVEEELNERFIRDTALARKRVSVVQLLVVGLFSMLFVIIANVGIQSSCHYVSADVQVGAAEQRYSLHYGLWKYSPIGSAFQGYTYCDEYNEYSGGPPTLPRVAFVLAAVAGAYSVLVLWWYLIFGQATRKSWYSAANIAFIAALLHGACFSIFISPVCKDRECKMGPAAALTIAASAMSFILGFEMYYNSPITSWRDDVPGCPSEEEPSRMIRSLEMTHIQESVVAFCKRLIPNATKQMPTLNQFQRNNEDHHIGDLVSKKVVYSPPSMV